MPRTVVLNRRRLAAKLNALPGAARKEIDAALAAWATEMVGMAQNLVPYRTGELYESIGWTRGKAPADAFVVATGRATGDIQVTVFAGSEAAYYARWVEFGTERSPAQPYFFVSYRTTRRRGRLRVSRAVNRAAAIVARGDALAGA